MASNLPAVHPALAAMLGDGAPMDTPLEQLRESSDRVGRETAGEPPAGVVARDLHVPLADGERIDVRVYRLEGADPYAAPAIVYFHGGGWATGTLDGFDAVARNLARFSDGVVVSVDYRLAPEHAHPVQLDDSVAAVRWVREHAAMLGVDAARIALAGDSAGAHLALGAALALRDADALADDERDEAGDEDEDEGDEDAAPIAGVLAFYPCLDPACDTPSWDALGSGHYLTRERMRYYWRALLGARADRPAASASPWLAEDLSGLPPTWVMVAECDPLRDEGEAFAQDLREAGVTVHAERRAGMLHGFLRWRTLVPDEADGAVEAACRWLAAQRA